MSTPLSLGAWEVLRALVLGVRIREFADGWRAVGPWQDPAFSQIDSATIGELLSTGFVDREAPGIGQYVCVTDAGQKALGEKTCREVREGLEWLRTATLTLEGC